MSVCISTECGEITHSNREAPPFLGCVTSQEQNQTLSRNESSLERTGTVLAESYAYTKTTTAVVPAKSVTLWYSLSEKKIRDTTISSSGPYIVRVI